MLAPKRGPRSPFSSEQDFYLESFFPHLLAQPADGVNAWKKQKAAAIIASPLFLGKLPTKEQNTVNGTTQEGWITVRLHKPSILTLIPSQRIEKKFQNHFNRHSSSLLKFSPLSGIALFEKENREIILTSAKDLAASSNTRVDVCYQTCRQEKWDTLAPEEQCDYETRASNTDISIAT